MKLLFALLIFISPVVYAQQLRIGVFDKYKVQRIIFEYNDGNYSIYCDSILMGEIAPNEFIDITNGYNGSIIVKKGAVSLGSFSKVSLIQTNPNTSLVLTSKSPVLKLRKYKDDFEIFTTKDGLSIINVVDMNHYLAGVIESEGGGGRALEYYKVQAVMSRTYAIKYGYRHNEEGFDLCDNVHCQAYHSMLRFTSKIDSAVVQTRGVVMVDKNGQLLDSYFHANCGGQTSPAEFVWNKPVSYLYSFKDTFCIHTHQSTWEKKIPKYLWKNFLVEKYNYPIHNPYFEEKIYTFNQSYRKAFYQSPSLGIPLRDLRAEFKLKSTFFSCYPEGDFVILKGKGFGHGIGLCQEGSMNMAKYGYNYLQIGQFYFPNAYFKNINEELYFKQQMEFLEFK